MRYLIHLESGILTLVTLACAFSCADAQVDIQVPYQALVINDDVMIRSGPDASFYATSKLSRGSVVMVYRDASDGWCAISPPKGSFSLVPASAVELIDSQSGTIRVDERDGPEKVRVWVGTQLGPVDRPRSQISLNANDRIEILGEIRWPSPDGESTNWYQILPPAKELRWIQVADLRLPSHRTQQPEATSVVDKNVSTQLNQGADAESNRDGSSRDVSLASMHSVVEPMTPSNDSQPDLPLKVAQQTSVVDFEQFNNNAAMAFRSNLAGNPLFSSSLQRRQQRSDIGVNFFRTDDDFTQGLVIEGEDVAMKIGGYVKLDLIQDFNPIDSTDLFDVLSIPVGAPNRSNSRFHARQTRLNFDTRWKTQNYGVIRAFVEGDFFSGGDQFRLRHAYGELGHFLGGKTFTTFANLAAAPATLDFEGSISAITLRRTQVRWTFPVFHDDLNLSVALEDSVTAIELPPGGTITGETRTISPDLVARLRRTRPSGNLQVAGIIRELGFQPTGESVATDNAWGLNFSQFQELTPNDKIYWQINYGDGIASLLGGLPDITPVGTDDAALLGYFGWMIGSTRDWNAKLSSNLTFAESHFQNTSGQLPSDVNNLTYLAANLIWTPAERFSVGVEYLYGKRENIDGGSGIANRVQFAVFYYLP